MRTPSLWAIVVLVVVVLLLFGARRLPDVAASVGKSLKIFKKEVKDLTEDDAAPVTTPASGPQSSFGHNSVAPSSVTDDLHRT